MADKHITTHRKTTTSSQEKPRYEYKRPKSSAETVSTKQQNASVNKNKKKNGVVTYRNSNEVSNDPRVPKTRVKVYKYNQNAIIKKNDQNNKSSLKSKSQSNLMMSSTIDERMKKLKTNVIKASLIYANNNNSSDMHKHKQMQDLKSKTPEKYPEKPAPGTVSNLSAMTKSINKSHKYKAQKPHESGQNNSLIGESG